jgi:hypothetical protein
LGGSWSAQAKVRETPPQPIKPGHGDIYLSSQIQVSINPEDGSPGWLGIDVRPYLKKNQGTWLT